MSETGARWPPRLPGRPRPRPQAGLLVLLICAALAWWAPAAAREESAPRRPNVILFLADDLGWGDLGCYGHPKFRTPNLDRMAREGARFTQFYAACPYCAPSRAALLTGRYPFRYGFTGNPLPIADPAGRPELDALGLPQSERTLGDLFRSAGYRTACIGKWHLGHRPPFRPLQRGFDQYLGILYSNDMHRVELIDGDRVIEYPVVQATLTRRYTDRALSFIERHRESPFFLYFPHAMPHKPLAASEEFYKKSGDGLYGDVISELDANVGRVLDRVRSLGLDDNTLICFTSDNGPWYGGSSGGLRGMKGVAWEGGVREPLLMRWPGKIPAGQVIADPGSLPDLFATALGAAGIEAPAGRIMDGVDLLPRLRAGSRIPERPIFITNAQGLAAVRLGRWKLLLTPPSGPAQNRVWQPDEPYRDPRAPDGVRLLAPYEQAHPSTYPGLRGPDPGLPPALYDLESDPTEQRNVAADHPEIVARLRRLAERARRQRDLE